MARPVPGIRERTLRSVVRLVVVLSLLLIIPAALMLGRSFRQLEAREAIQDLLRAQNAVEDQLKELNRIARDYGTWDATWAYVAGRGAADYLTTNYADPTFLQNRLSLVVLLQTAPNEAAGAPAVIFAKAYELEHQQGAPVPNALVNQVPRLAQLKGQSGLVQLGDAVFLVGTSPVQPSTGEGAANGVLLIARRLDPYLVAHLARSTRLELSLRPAPAEAADPPRPTVELLDADRLEVRTALVDVDHRPVAQLVLRADRVIWAEGRTALWLLAAVLAIVAVSFLWLLRRLLDRVVLSRLAALASDVRHIGETHNPDLRVAGQGGDELGTLAQAINEMLDALQRLHRLLLVEQDKSERLLLNVLPRAIADRLKQSGDTIADSFPDASVLFADLVNFTRFSAGVTAIELVTLLDDLFTRFDLLAERHQVEKIKTIGDAYMVVSGLPQRRADHAHAITAMALDMLSELAAFNAERGTAFQLRVGMHDGPVVAGVIGRHKFIYDIWGDTVNTASRLEASGVAGAIQVSEAFAARIADQFITEPRGTLELKGKGTMAVCLVLARRPAPA